MGSYTKNLFKRGKSQQTGASGSTSERIKCCAIRWPDGQIMHGYRSYAELRHAMGYEIIYDTRHGDTDGFFTTDERFVNRIEARAVAVRAGQAAPAHRELLSSDLLFWP